MARGKHGDQAARRRAEAAETVLDRVNDQLAEAKIKARTYEAEARQNPLLRARIDQLQQYIDMQTGAEVIRLNGIIANLQAEVDRHRHDAEDRAARWDRFVARIVDLAGGGVDGLQAAFNTLGWSGTLMADDAMKYARDKGMDPDRLLAIQRARTANSGYRLADPRIIQRKLLMARAEVEIERRLAEPDDYADGDDIPDVDRPLLTD